MSVQFGKCNFDLRQIDSQELEEVRPVLAPYGPDREGLICTDGIGILFRAFHTTPESEKEQQPIRSASGALITLDGRLDNHEELVAQLGDCVSRESGDLEIVSAAYDRWGNNSFAKLLGDWAISLWNFKDRSLTLAKDVIGTRPLYYTISGSEITWCTILDPLVLFARQSLKLDREYVAGWLSSFPATHLTPYVGINAVPPSSFVRITRDRTAITKYWDFDSGKSTRYATDSEYEEHFRFVFAESVRRRLRSKGPVLAELSGGMDSTSIVCMADTITGEDPAGRLDTVSYYDDHEPNWNERPFFTRVEQQRGKPGLHIEVGSQTIFSFDVESSAFAVAPASELMSTEPAKQLSAHLDLHGYRVLLSGIGGDETLGGVPTPAPELADLLARANLLRLAHQLKAWALIQRKPWLLLLSETVREFLPTSMTRGPKHRQPPVWIRRDLVRQYRPSFRGYETRLRLFGPLPSFQENLRALEGLRRQLACVSLRKDPPCEVRYPYLDRSLLEFVYSVPRTQLLRPGQRRSLMRRAMAHIVPTEVLTRRRKAFVSRGPTAAILQQWPGYRTPNKGLISGSLGIVDSDAFAETLQKTRDGQEVAIAPLLRLTLLERWLTGVCSYGIFSVSKEEAMRQHSPTPTLISAEKC